MEREVDFSALRSSEALLDLAFVVVAVIFLVAVLAAIRSRRKGVPEPLPLPQLRRRNWFEELWDEEVLGLRADWDRR